MEASVEISLYPLQTNYETPILAFIGRLKEYPELRLKPNTMSTQVFGPYDRLMEILTLELKKSFLENPDTVAVLKIVNLNLY